MKREMSAQLEPRSLAKAGGEQDPNRSGVILLLRPESAQTNSEPSGMNAEEKLKPARGLLIGLLAGAVLWLALGMAVRAIFRF